MTSFVGLFQLADNLLRGEVSAARGSRNQRLPMLGSLIVAIVVYGMFYGAVMGSYGATSGLRIWQAVYSAVKVPFLLITTFLLSLPSFFVLNTLLGLRDDFPRVVRALISTQAGLTVILSALAPFTAFWYVSGSDYEPAILFNGLMFAVASFSAQWMLRRQYCPLGPRQSPASLDAGDLDPHLRLRGHPDGMGAPAFYRQPQSARSILPGGGLEQRL